MKRKLFRLSLFLLLLTSSMIHVSAQQTVLTAGGELAGENGTGSYSIGQTFYSSISGSGGLVIHGIQQPSAGSLTDTPSISVLVDVEAYPNPITDFITLTIRNTELTGLTYQLCDLTGKVLGTNSITNNQLKIDVSNYASSVYLLNITHNNIIIKTIKIIKK